MFVINNLVKNFVSTNKLKRLHNKLQNILRIKNIHLILLRMLEEIPVPSKPFSIKI